MIVEQQPKFNSSIPTKTSFGQRFQTKAFKDSLLFCVDPCRHFERRSSDIKSLNIDFINVFIALGEIEILLNKIDFLQLQRLMIYVGFL